MIKSSLTDEERKAMEEEWVKAQKGANAIREQIKSMITDLLGKTTQMLGIIEDGVKPFSADYWQRKDDIEAIHSIHNRLMEYNATGKCRRDTRLCDLYVIDKHSKQIHRIGEHDHDSLSTILGYVDYVNLQCGDGGGVDSEDGYGYAIIKSDSGSLCDEFGIIDQKYVKEIIEYLKEQGEDISVFDNEGHFIRDNKD